MEKEEKRNKNNSVSSDSFLYLPVWCRNRW